MAFTALGALVTTVVGMTITGIATNAKFAFRPRRISAAQLPILYTRLPGSSRQTSTLGYQQGLRMATIEIVIISAMLNLDTQENNDAATVVLIDSLAAALESNAAALGMDSYSITTDEDTIGDGATVVQAIIATVEVSG